MAMENLKMYFLLEIVISHRHIYIIYIYTLQVYCSICLYRQYVNKTLKNLRNSPLPGHLAACEEPYHQGYREVMEALQKLGALNFLPNVTLASAPLAERAKGHKECRYFGSKLEPGVPTVG